MPYGVVYNVMGKERVDLFSDFETALRDYEIKLNMDKEMLFDDRFVIGITDDKGRYVKERFGECGDPVRQADS